MRAYKTEVKLAKGQEDIYARTVGVCRYVYNMLIDINDERHANGLPYINNYAFSKWLNNEFIKNNPDKSWIKDVSSKAVRDAIDNAHSSFTNFFKLQRQKGYAPYTKKQIAHAERTGETLTYYDKQGHPRYKRRHANDCSYYFVRNSKSQAIQVERHRIKVPVLGWVRLKEFGYIPQASAIINGTITKQAGRYYISVQTDEPLAVKQNNINDGIGIDLGIKPFAALSNGMIEKTVSQNKLEKKLKREQRRFSRKLEMNKTDGKTVYTNGMKKQRLKIAKIHKRIANIREDRHNKLVDKIVRAKPSYITIEDLNVKGMMSNRHLSRAIAGQGLYSFRLKLTNKAREYGIEVRVADRFYPSSKKCNACGAIKLDLKLRDRVFYCDRCNYIADRDINAAFNLHDCMQYNVV